MMMSSRSFVIMFILNIVCINHAIAAEIYLKLGGHRLSGKSVHGEWRNNNCYGNLRAAMAVMSSGDTLIIDDGIYTGVSNSIDRAHYPPSGSRQAFTVVRARN